MNAVFLFKRVVRMVGSIFCLHLFCVLWMAPTVVWAVEPGTNSRDMEPVVLQLKWFHQFQFAGYYAALHKGFYQAAGLDVNIVEGRPGIDFVERVVSGRANYGIEMPDLLLKRAQNKPVVLLACIYQHSPIALISLAKTNIYTPHDLLGRTIMLRAESNADLRAMISLEGLNLNAINIVEHSFNIEDLISGKVDAMGLYSTAYGAELKQRGIAFSVLSPYSYGVDFYGDCLFTSEEEMRQNPERVKAFRTASLKGWEYAMDHPEEIARIIHQYYSPKSVEVLLDEAQQMEPLLLHRVIKIGHINPGRWEHIREIFVSQGMLSPDFTLEGFIYDPSLPTDPDLNRNILGIVVVVALLLILAGVLLLLFNGRLKGLVLKKTEELSASNRELSINEEILNASQEIAHIGSWHLNINKNTLTWSAEEYRIFGVTRDDFQGTYDAFLRMVHPDDRDMVNGKYIRALKEGKLYECIHRIVKPDGEVRIIHEKSKEIRDCSGEVLHSYGMTHDITELEQVKAQYQRSLAEFEAIFNSITDAIVFVDQDRYIVMVNPAFQQVFGYEFAEIKGQSTQLIYADIRDFECQGQQRYNRERNTALPEYEVEYRRKDGSIFPSETLGGPVFDRNGTTIGFFGVIRDISGKKKVAEDKARLEGQLRQAQKLEAVGTLAGGIAHDFNNILSVVLGFTEMAIEEAPAGSALADYLQQVLVGGNRAKELVKQILAFSRHSQVERIVLNPVPLVKEGMKMVRASLPTTISIKEDIDLGSGTILADPTQVHQIILNLCTNAFHAMEKTGGVLTVRVKPVVLDGTNAQVALKPGSYVQLSFQDTGAGIDPASIDHIFDPFYTTKEVGKGTGMGLAIIHGIVSEYGGAVTVSSTLGLGTTFDLFFPVVAQEEPEPSSATLERMKGSERILLVDDEDLLVEMGKTMLERLGYTVSVCRDGLMALNLFAASPDDFDLVITDQTMPGMTGADMAKKMLQIRSEMPIILYSGYSSLIDEAQAETIGIKAFALKPLTLNSLAKLIRDVLD